MDKEAIGRPQRAAAPHEREGKGVAARQAQVDRGIPCCQGHNKPIFYGSDALAVVISSAVARS